jgi:hypothetical protein
MRKLGTPPGFILNAFLSVLTFAAAEGEKRNTVNIKNLTSAKVEKISANSVHLTALPTCEAAGFRHIQLFVGTIQEADCIGALTKSIYNLSLFFGAIP